MKKLILAIALCCFALCGEAQKVKITGDIKSLKGITEANVIFTYDNMTVGKMTEADYTAKKVSEYNEKESGKGDEWLKTWELDKQNVYPAKFCELLSKYGNIENSENAKYKFTVQTDFFEPGFNVGVMRRNAYIDVTITITESASGTEIAKVVMLNSPGRSAGGYDFSVSSRVAEAYAKAGKELGARIAKGK